jgi:hypothetical protein
MGCDWGSFDWAELDRAVLCISYYMPMKLGPGDQFCKLTEQLFVEEHLTARLICVGYLRYLSISDFKFVLSRNCPCRKQYTREFSLF